MDVLFYVIAAIIVAWSIYCLVRAAKNAKKGCGCRCAGCNRDCSKREKKN
ncbi:MAG TPA: FeoB-associated Cys-rich membrane protein [Clostridia bacterium]|nr:FeoB-associated Cys-rich membrane protein [Clostridia bacterium]